MSPWPERPVRVVLTGFSLAIGELSNDLGRQHEVELVGAAGRIGEAAWAFSGQEVDVVVHATAGGVLPRADLTEIREYTHAPIVLLADTSSPAFLEDALEADVHDVVLTSQPVEQLAFAVRKAARRARAGDSAERQARVVTVFSPKGGTGKTVLSTNLATAVAKHGARALLVDLDLQFGDAAIMLDLAPERTVHDLATAPGDLDADKLHGYVVRHARSGLEVLAAPLRPEQGEAVTAEKTERVLELARAHYDVIVVDTSPSFHEPMLAALDWTDVVLLVTTPEVPTLKNVRLGGDTLRRLSVPAERVKLVLNRSDPAVGMHAPEITGVLGMQVAYELPSDPRVPVTVNEGTPLALSEPDSAFALAVDEIARSLLGKGNAARRRPAVEADEGGLVGTVRGLATSLLASRAPAPIPRSARTA